MFYENYEELSTNEMFARGESGKCYTPEPIWMLAQEIKTKDDIELVTVPLQIPASEVKDGFGAQILFYPNNECEFPVQIVFYEAKDYNNTCPFLINNCSFSGVSMVFDFCTCSATAYNTIDGELAGFFEIDPSEFSSCSSIQLSDRNDIPCFDDWGQV